MSEKLVNKIDLAIEKLADDIANDKILMEFRAETIKALAELVSARACPQKLHKVRISHIEIIDGVLCIPVRHPYERTFHYEPLVDHL